MNKGFYLVMIAQALSSVADNALLIAAIALIAELSGPDWMAPMMKWWFALAYVVLAAFVGAFADSFPKGKVMFITNAVKIAGCFLMFNYENLGLGNAHQLVLELKVSEDEIAQRRAAWQAPAPRYRRGVQAKFAFNAASASKGAVLDNY